VRFSWLGSALAAIALAPTLASGQAVTRGPYLQRTTPSSVVVRWRTDVATDSVVQYGTSLALGSSRSTPTPTTEHLVTLTALPPDTVHYYAVGHSGGLLEGGDASYTFSTAPVPGSPTSTRIWVLGDSGKANQGARNVRDGYQSFTGSRGTDVWLMLGDNAYNDGTDAEFQAAVFDIYPQTLRQVALWPTLGNHDTNSASSATQSGPYFDIFTLPSEGEAGGVASGTEAYYSFDHANIHFICLDSDDSPVSPNSPMLRWLEDDLAVTDQDWIIAYWHHPPYAKGGMNSDVETHGTLMRENVLPVLEAYGVDLVLSGHDHSYQRSFLVNGHYGLSTTFTPEMALNGGDGREAGDGAYQKPDGLVPNRGAVYTVAGSSASSGPGPFDHPTTVIGLDQLGSVVIDVDGARLDAAFVTDTGAVVDAWTLIKGADEVPPGLVSATAIDPYTVEALFSEAIDPASLSSPAQWDVAPLETVSNAVLQPNGRTVRLTTSRLAPGTYTVSAWGIDDLFGNTTPPGTQTEFEFSAARSVNRTLSAPGNDAEQNLPTGVVSLTDSVLELGATAAGAQLVGLRFTDLPIPKGATIDAADVLFQVQARSRDAASLSIEAEAADDAPPFTSSTNDLGMRSRVTPVVAWSPPEWKKGAAGVEDARTPDLSTLLQAVVSRPGWSTGRALVLLFSGTGLRAAQARESGTNNAAVLHVDYTLPLPACSDGIDNDADGLIDYPLDPGCTSDEANTEKRTQTGTAGCGIGPELLGVLLLVACARRRRGR